jgi:putative transposase
MPKRKHISPSQKAQIALEILKEEKTVSQIASSYGVHPNVLYRLKKQALENLPELFVDDNKSARTRHSTTASLRLVTQLRRPCYTQP